MDLGAYAQIDDLSYIMKENNIDVPRLRGLRLMKNERLITEEEIENAIRGNWLNECESACRSGFEYNPYGYTLSESTDLIIKKYLILDKDGRPVDVRWKNIHGKKRKLFKYRLKQSKQLVRKQLETFNKYCGRENVLYIHARIGGYNWAYYEGARIASEPWFIEKVDDYFDNTYCDIYARIK